MVNYERVCIGRMEQWWRWASEPVSTRQQVPSAWSRLQELSGLITKIFWA